MFYKSSALSIDKSFTETRQLFLSTQIIFNPSRKLSINYGHFLRDNTLSLIGENVDNRRE